MILEGQAHKYGDNVDTDVIIPARYLAVSDTAELGKHCLEDLDADFVKKVQPGDIILAGENFGCGSSREHAPLAIRGAGVLCVIGGSFARIFFRNAINIGLPVFICPEAVAGSESGDRLRVDAASGTIENVTNGTTYQAAPLPDFLRSLVAAGGLVPYTRARLGLG